jgi:hypothetical protein
MALNVFATYLDSAEQGYDETEKAERWYLEFAVPRVDWDTEPYFNGDEDMPDKGDAPPDNPKHFPVELAVGGYCLRRQIDFSARPGYVMIKLTYGFNFANSLNEGEGVVTGRSFLVTKKLTHAGDGTLLMGPVIGAAGKPTRYEMDIRGGHPRETEMCFQQVRITAVLSTANVIAYCGPLYMKGGGLNSATWQVLGTNTIGIDQMMFRGCTWDISNHSTRANRLYLCHFDFLIHPYTWQLGVITDKYELCALKVPYELASDGSPLGHRTISGRKLAGAWSTTTHAIRLAYDYGGLLGDLL